MNEIWSACQVTLDVVDKFHKALGKNDDLIRNMHNLKELTKEYLFCCITAMEIKSPVHNVLRDNFMHDFQCCTSSFANTVSSAMAKSGLTKFNLSEINTCVLFNFLNYSLERN